MEERTYHLFFSLFPGIGPKKFASILSHYKSSKYAWEDSLSNYKQCNISTTLLAQFQKYQQLLNTEEYLEKLDKKHIGFVASCEKNYPIKLIHIENPPIVLFYKGDANLLGEDIKKIAVVGTRRITNYGKQVTENFVEELSRSFAVVSGLALGVDAAAHKTALNQKAPTIGVLGCGVDLCYPANNRDLYQQMINGKGLVISEYPPGEQPNKGTFPARNRIIAGISEAVLVTEAGGDSGSLITAEVARKLGRKVFAVPGPITSRMSDGTSILIKQGAVLCTSPQDIFDGLKVKKEVALKADLKLSKEERRVVKFLSNGEVEIDLISKETGLKISTLSTILSELELRGIIQNLGSGIFCLKQ